MITLLGMLLDAAFGEPRWLWSRLPHPAVLMGRVIGWMDHRWNRGGGRRAKGVAALCALVLGAALLGIGLTRLFGAWAQILVLAVLLAQRSLSDHVLEVAHALRRSLPEGRQAVAQIVGRDTAQMDAPAVARSAIESAAENLSDGVTAPLLWFIVAGLPGLLVYKVTNTADSMIGYMTPRHAEFGWAAARFDDLLNYVPARLTAGLIMLVSRRLDVTARVWSEAPLHRSPNAGWPEAALAHALGFALSGPRSYDGALRDYPFVNEGGLHALGPDQIAAAVRLLWKTWAALLVLVALMAIS